MYLCRLLKSNKHNVVDHSYLPSVGAVLLVAAVLKATLLAAPVTLPARQARPSRPSRGTRCCRRCLVWAPLGAGAVVALLCCAAIVGGAGRTWRRVPEWRSDEVLFRSAEQVCPNSAKIHYQLGQVWCCLTASSLCRGDNRRPLLTVLRTSTVSRSCSTNRTLRQQSMSLILRRALTLSSAMLMYG